MCLFLRILFYKQEMKVQESDLQYLEEKIFLPVVL